MGTFIIILPDVGEGIAEAELTEWQVSVGDVIAEDDILGVVMTDKAAVEVPSSVNGKVKWLCGNPGDMLAIGSRFVEIEVEGAGNEDEVAAAPAAEEETPVAAAAAPEAEAAPTPAPSGSATAPAASKPTATPAVPGQKPLAAPSVRQRAKDAGIELADVAGTGPAGRISHEDLDAHIASPPSVGGGIVRGKATGTTEIKVIGMRRRIAQKMALSKSRIPHITIVEEVDVTELEDLRQKLNASYADTRGKLTILPFLARAIVEAVKEHPEMNALYDDDADIVTQHEGVHIGIAAQTPAGLTVPVVKHVEAMSVWDSAAEIGRLSKEAKDGASKRDDLTGSTITISSLGALGALATTPIINHPEVAILGVNKMAVRPMWNGQEFVPRSMMNISSSFDHRVVDGWDAAVFVRKLKDLLETPALLFVEG